MFRYITIITGADGKCTSTRCMYLFSCDEPDLITLAYSGVCRQGSNSNSLQSISLHTLCCISYREFTNVIIILADMMHTNNFLLKQQSELVKNVFRLIFSKTLLHNETTDTCSVL